MSVEFDAYISTYDIAEGTCDLRTFALRCAKALGWPVDSDERHLTTAPRTLDAAWYEKEADAARSRLPALLAMSLADAEAECEQMYQKELADHRRHQAENMARRVPYERLLQQALAWQPPSGAEGRKVQDLMVSTLRKEIDHVWDCDEPQRKDASVWLAEAIADTRRAIVEFPKRAEQDRQRDRDRAARVAALHQSLSLT